MNRSSIGRVLRLHLFLSRYLHPNYHCCHLLQSDVWTLLISLRSKSESATASQSTISSAWKPKNRSSLSESFKRSVLKTNNAFLQLDFQKLSHFCFIHKDNANHVEEVAKVLYCYYSQDSYEIVRKFTCMEVVKFTHLDWMFCPQPRADIFGHCAQRRVNAWERVPHCPWLSQNVLLLDPGTNKMSHEKMCVSYIGHLFCEGTTPTPSPSHLQNEQNQWVTDHAQHYPKGKGKV